MGVNPASTTSSSRGLAWFFVTVWGSAYLASRVGLQYAPPFTFLTLRFAFGMLLIVPLALLARPVCRAADCWATSSSPAC